jgi:PBSX family phage terminase large subunit
MSTLLTEYQDQLEVPNFQPSQKQTQFLSSNAYEVFFGGAAGPGKSAALCAEAVTSCLEDPGHHTYIFRKTIPELKQSIVPEIKKQCADYLENMPYNSQDRRFNFSNGSYIQLAYCDNPGDYFRYQSAEIHTLLFDELTHFTQDEYEYLKTRVRSVEPRLLRVMSASNPGNVGHGWVKSYFIDVTRPGDVYTDPDTNLTRVFIPAVIDDHPIASFRKSYRKTLESIPSRDLRKALLEGDWNIFAGQVYAEWRRVKHVISKLPVFVEDCNRYIGLDWGYNDPTSVHWIAETPKNSFGVKHYYVYRELYGSGKRPEEWAYDIMNFVKDEPVEYLAMPHDTFDNIGGTRPIVEQFKEVFRKHGVNIRIERSSPATHSAKINRQALIHDMLAIQADGLPKLQVHDTCFNLIRTLPMLPYSTNRIEEIDDKADDHAYDSLSYGLYAITERGNFSAVTPHQPQVTTKEGYIVENDRLLYNIDMSKLLKQSSKENKDWKYS